MEGKANYLTLKEAAEQLGIHPNTLRNWERRGVIRLDRLPGSRYRRVPIYEVRRLERELASPAPPVAEQAPPPDDWHVRIDWPTDDPEVLARAEAMYQQIQEELAQDPPAEMLEEVMSRLRGYAWLP